MTTPDATLTARRRLVRAVVVGAAVTLAIARWPGDRLPWLALVAYVPPPLVALAAGLALVDLRRRRDGPRWQAVAGVALALSLVTTGVDNRRLLASAPAPPPPGARVLVHWNVMHSAGAAAVLSSLPCDVLCVTEPARDVTYASPEWRSGSVVLAARAPVEQRAVLRGPGLRALHAVVRCEPPLSVLLVDVDASLELHRARPLEALARALEDLAPPADVVVGDFNTPAGSASIEAALGRFPDAYGLAGAGPGYTWPSVLPLLRLDQVRVREGLPVLGYETGASVRSDHRWQRVVLGR